MDISWASVVVPAGLNSSLPLISTKSDLMNPYIWTCSDDSLGTPPVGIFLAFLP